MAEWSPSEDMRPGIALTRTQPELTPKGYVWTQIVVTNWPAPGITQMTIRYDGGQYLLGHGRVYPIPPKDEDDGA
jgi:hypothetical protein